MLSWFHSNFQQPIKPIFHHMYCPLVHRKKKPFAPFAEGEARGGALMGTIPMKSYLRPSILKNWVCLSSQRWPRPVHSCLQNLPIVPFSPSHQACYSNHASATKIDLMQQNIWLISSKSWANVLLVGWLTWIQPNLVHQHIPPRPALLIPINFCGACMVWVTSLIGGRKGHDWRVLETAVH